MRVERGLEHPEHPRGVVLRLGREPRGLEPEADPQAQARIEQAAWHLMAVDHVMKKAKLESEGA